MRSRRGEEGGCVYVLTSNAKDDSFPFFFLINITNVNSDFSATFAKFSFIGASTDSLPRTSPATPAAETEEGRTESVC